MALHDSKPCLGSTQEERTHLVAKVVAAERAEAAARRDLRERNAALAALLAEASAAGLDDDYIARKLLRHRLGRAPTPEERRKERERVKKRRHRGTVRPGKDSVGTKNELTTTTRNVRSAEEGKNMPEHLIRRKTVTTEEEFAVDQEDDEQEDDEEIACDADQKSAADEGEEDDDDEEGEEDDEG